MGSSSHIDRQAPAVTEAGSGAGPSTSEAESNTLQRLSMGDELRLRFNINGSSTKLAGKAAWGNLRAARPTIDEAGRNSLIVQHVGPGLLPGDSFVFTADIEAGADVALTGQGATRIFPLSDADDAAVRVEVRTKISVAAGASLLALWDPIIPYRKSRMLQETSIDLADDSRIIWMDTLAAGRVASGESFGFDLLEFLSLWRLQGREIMAERLALTARSVRSRLGWGNARFMTTLVAYAPDCESFDLKSWVTSAHGVSDIQADADADADWSASQPHRRLIVLRSLGVTREAAQRPALELVDHLHKLLWNRPFADFRKY